MVKVKKVRVLSPKIKEIDEYPNLARASLSELESKFKDNSEDDNDDKDSFSEKNKKLIESTDPILESAIPQIREIPLKGNKLNPQNNPQINNSSIIKNKGLMEKENKFYSETSISSSMQESQKNYTKTFSSVKSRNIPSISNSSPMKLKRSQIINDPTAVNPQNNKSNDVETTYSKIESGLKKEKSPGRRPWEA